MCRTTCFIQNTPGGNVTKKHCYINKIRYLRDAGFFMEKHYIKYYLSPVGWLQITTDHLNLISILFADKEEKSDEDIPQILQETITQLMEYFEGTRKFFQLKLAPSGTGFQQKIWKLVENVPFGETAAYLDIALKSGSEKNTRAVGLANGKNPIPIVIPCHRIIGNNGKLTGYAGGLDKKRWLLAHEQKHAPKENLLF